jgi:hypothetical protein
MSNMQRVTLLLSDPLFWMVTVALSLALSVVANYVTRGIDRWWSHRRTETEGQQAKQIAAYEAVAAHLASHPRDQFNLRLDILYFGQQKLFFSLASLVSDMFAVIGALLFKQGFTIWLFLTAFVGGFITFLLSVYATSRQARARRALRAYERISADRSYADVLNDALGRNANKPAHK